MKNNYHSILLSSLFSLLLLNIIIIIIVQACTHGTQKWRFGRSLSFSIGCFLGSMLIFRGVHQDALRHFLLNCMEKPKLSKILGCQNWYLKNNWMVHSLLLMLNNDSSTTSVSHWRNYSAKLSSYFTVNQILNSWYLNSANLLEQIPLLYISTPTWFVFNAKTPNCPEALKPCCCINVSDEVTRFASSSTRSRTLGWSVAHTCSWGHGHLQPRNCCWWVMG